MADINFKGVSTYQKGSYPFPKDDIDPKLKNDEWGKQWCEAIYAAYVSDRAAMPFSSLEELQELRAYADGNQDVSKYQQLLLSENEEDGTLEGFLNLNWDIFSVMPKFMHILTGIFEEQEHDIVATAVDPKSSDEKAKIKLQKWFKSQFRGLMKSVYQMNGVEPEQEWIPESADELKIYETMGGLKIVKETEIEEALQYTFYISDWPEVKRKIIRDYASINCAAVKDYTDQYTKRVKTRYVDPLCLIMQYSKHWDHRNCEYAGELIQESISNVRKNTSLSEDQLREIAQFYNGKGLNQNISNWTEDSLKMNNGTFKYDSFMIDIMDAEWFSVNSQYRTTRINSRGEEWEYESDWGEVKEKENRKTRIHKYKTVYRCKWIIGTDFVYDFGLQYDIPRPGKKEVELSFKFYKLPGRSLVSLSVPNLDQIQLTWLKMQNAIAMASNKGIAVEYTSLQNMKLGDKKMDPIDILGLRRDTGDYIYKLTTHTGRPNVPGGMRPVQELEGGIGSQLDEFMRIFEMNLEFIRDLTGINRIADASNPDPNQSVGGSQLAIAATTNALRPIYSAYIRMKELTAKSCTLRLQVLLRHSEEAYEGYIPVIGSAGVKIMTLDADTADAEYHIKIQARPTAQRKQTILDAAIAAMQPNKDGYIGIEYPEFLMIERLLEDGNLKLAEYFLAYRSMENKKRQIALQRENMELDSKNAQETARVKAEEDRQTLKFKTDEDIRVKKAEADLEDRNNANEHERKKELILLEGQFKNIKSKSA